ncbi:MAG: tRNA pseudouridine(55) synthase TruB [Desulfomonile tiedjei]|nr:tRNA pseudouridine(55) synthase TruB [Desulfomonile tiedjei]
MHGILLIDKPEGITSNDVLRIIKRLLKPAKVGHSGTLDPAASGLMVVLIGAGTRALDYLDENRKTYALVVRLGEETDTGDRDGVAVRTGDPSGLNLQRIQEVVDSYRGVMDQIPPHYSAIKKNGVPLYKLARKGVFPDLAARKIEIFSLVLKDWELPLLALDLICSKGTYARSLARDIGRDLDVGGRLESLRRMASGPFRVEDALKLDAIADGGKEIIAKHMISLARALSHIPDLQVTIAEVRRLMRGTDVVLPRARLPVAEDPSVPPARLYKIVSGNDGLVILIRPEPKGAEISLRPVKVFNTWENK